MSNNNFINGLQNASDYLNTTKVDIPTNVTGNITDQGAGVNVSTTSYSMKELICGLLAGNGLQLPNIQICLSVNIARALNMPGLPNDIRNALSEAESALNDFIAHTNIDNVLGRLNAAVAEFAAIANMINFCGTPVVPRPIPNVLKDSMGSFLGAGKDILDTLGTMAESDIGGCISTDGGFNPNLFTGGILKQLSDNIDNLANMPQSVIDSIKNDLNAFSNDIKNLIEFENNFSGTDSKGGSTFTPGVQPVNTGVGVALDAENMSFSQGAAIAGNLQGLYDQLHMYEVDDQGNNIFNYLLTPDAIANLSNSSDPVFPLADREPVYDYCGKQIGYTDRSMQQQPLVSGGAPAEDIVSPGSTGLQESGAVVFTPPSTTTNVAKTSSTIGLQELKQIVADSTDFNDFKNRIQNL